MEKGSTRILVGIDPKQVILCPVICRHVTWQRRLQVGRRRSGAACCERLNNPAPPHEHACDPSALRAALQVTEPILRLRLPEVTLVPDPRCLCGGIHRHDHHGLLFTALCLDNCGLVHPPHHAIANRNLVDGLVNMIDLQLRQGVQEILRALLRVR